jgi:DnaJ-class molecular chaperone
MDKPPEELKRIEDGFKLLGEALEVLGDPMKRQLYDEGCVLMFHFTIVCLLHSFFSADCQ